MELCANRHQCMQEISAPYLSSLTANLNCEDTELEGLQSEEVESTVLPSSSNFHTIVGYCTIRLTPKIRVGPPVFLRQCRIH